MNAHILFPKIVSKSIQELFGIPFSCQYTPSTKLKTLFDLSFLSSIQHKDIVRVCILNISYDLLQELCSNVNDHIFLENQELTLDFGKEFLNILTSKLIDTNYQNLIYKSSPSIITNSSELLNLENNSALYKKYTFILGMNKTFHLYTDV